MKSSRQHLLVCALFAAVILAGCSSAPKPSHTQTFEQSDNQSAELLSKAAGSLDRLGAENKKLRDENTELKKSVQTLQGYLRINDCLATNKEAIVQNLVETWAPHRSAIWSAQGGTGTVVDFAVPDVLLFRGMVVVDTVILAKKEDQTGILAKGAILLDPDKNLEVMDCVMEEPVPISAQDMVQLTSESQIEERARSIPAQPKANKDGEWRVSQENKDKAVGAGIAIGATLLYKLLDNYINQ